MKIFVICPFRQLMVMAIRPKATKLLDSQLISLWAVNSYGC